MSWCAAGLPPGSSLHVTFSKSRSAGKITSSCFFMYNKKTGGAMFFNHYKLSTFAYDKLGNDREHLKRSLSNRLIYSLGKDPITATHRDWFHTTAYAVRERLIERWMETMRSYYESNSKRVYYLSMEFLTGRLLSNSLLNMGFYGECREALSELELDLERIRELEADAALGNGGLGRLAACFLDSMATLRLPGYGYGIRYEYGMFNQRIDNGWQVEHP